jgi:osmotically-inducible protein OsmY
MSEITTSGNRPPIERLTDLNMVNRQSSVLLKTLRSFHMTTRDESTRDSSDRDWRDRNARRHGQSDGEHGGASQQGDYVQGQDWDRQNWSGGSGIREYGGQQNYGGRYGRDYNRDYASGDDFMGSIDSGSFYSGGTPRGATSAGWGGGDDASYLRTGLSPQPSYGGGSLQSLDRGNEGLFRGRGPRGYQRSDERIHEEVCESLTDDDHVDASDIEVSVKDGEVTLKGTVHSRDEKRRAEDVIENLPGVKDVHNSLQVF